MVKIYVDGVEITDLSDIELPEEVIEIIKNAVQC